MICKSGLLNLRNSQIGSSSCQCSTTSNGQEKETKRIVFSKSEKGQDVREEILAGTLDDKLEENEIPPLPKWYNDSRK